MRGRDYESRAKDAIYILIKTRVLISKQHKKIKKQTLNKLHKKTIKRT